MELIMGYSFLTLSTALEGKAGQLAHEAGTVIHAVYWHILDEHVRVESHPRGENGADRAKI